MSNLLEKASILLTPTAYDDGKILSVKPIDGSGDFQFTRNSNATRVNSAGLIESLQALSSNLVSNGDFSQEGSELITNGDFATDSDWTKQAGWTISGGKANCDGTQTAESNLKQSSLALGTGKIFKITFQLKDYQAGNLIYVNLTGTNTLDFENINANGTYVAYSGLSTGDNFIVFRADADFIGSIDNVSVKEVLQDWSFTSGASLTDLGAKITHTPTAGTISSAGYAPLVVGNNYKMTYEITESILGGVKINSAVVPTMVSTVGVHTKYFEADSTIISIARTDNTGNNVTITNVSIIEITDDTNLPRIDYSPYSGAGTCGHWLFEPQSTQTATYSNDFTQGDLFNSSSNPSVQDAVLTSQQTTSPDGTSNAWKLVDNNDGLTGQTALSYFSTTVIANNYNTISYFVKKQGSNNFVYINIAGFDASANGQTYFDIQNGTLGDVSANHTANIENYGNGWYRISITMQATTDFVGAIVLKLATSNGVGNILRDGTNGIYLFGVQAESDASRQFMTSYIPTNGSTVTRNQEAAFGAGNSDLINSTEGVLYAEAAKLNDNSLNFKAIGFNNGTQQERLVFIFGQGQEKIRFQARTNNVVVFQDDFNVTSLSQQNKIAVRYSNITGYAFFINGLKVGVNPSLIVPQITSLGFGVSGANFYGKTKCVAVFKEALTDDELECLTSDETSFSSFNALALANNYTII